MTRRRISAAVVAALVALMTLAPAALADTCCANTAVKLTPRVAMPGDTVRLDGIACLEADNTGPLALNPVEFWLSTDRVPADPNPGDTPGNPDVRLASDLPAAGQWHAFATVADQGKAAAGSATIVVPDLADGRYQLWWRCDNGGGPGSGIHYSAGARLTIGAGAPDTAAVPVVPAPVQRPSPPTILLVVGLAGGVLAARRFGVGKDRRAA